LQTLCLQVKFFLPSRSPDTREFVSVHRFIVQHFPMPSIDTQVRLAAFNWLAEQLQMRGDVLHRSFLEKGFHFEGQEIKLLGPQGIFKPAIMEIPLSITTVPGGPYDDHFGPDKLLRYRYRGSDPNHRDNVGLQQAMIRHIPLVYFHGIIPGRYRPVWPVYIVGSDPATLTFSVAADDMAYVRQVLNEEANEDANEGSDVVIRREYITTLTRRRLHQSTFREYVVHAYQEQCACCRLKHISLLDAAHIIPDSDPEGEPKISNGISLCKLHHAAFDNNIIGISPEYVIKVRPDVLEEEDGPMLLHGLQGMNEKKLIIPEQLGKRPNKEFLEKRFAEFRKVG
jgi:putative restriction endonuclease